MCNRRSPQQETETVMYKVINVQYACSNKFLIKLEFLKVKFLKNKWDKLPIDLLEVDFQNGNYD